MLDLGLEVPAAVEELGKNPPKFPDGRIDYTAATTAPVILCFVEWQGKILLLKRSDKVLSYKGKWTAVGGYLDEPKPLIEQAYQELREELGIEPAGVQSIKFVEPQTLQDAAIGKIWIIHPVLAVLRNEPKIVLDWEHTDYRWIQPTDIRNFDIVPGADRNLQRVLEKK